jgi:predicted dehydrogenase
VAGDRRATSDRAWRSSAPASGASSTLASSPPHPDAQLVAIAGRTRERADARARAYGVPAYVDLEAMLERERPDLVTVCLPNEGHFEPTLALLRSGVALLVEKPLVFELEQADALLAEAERQGRSSRSTSTTASPCPSDGGRRRRRRPPRRARLRDVALRRRAGDERASAREPHRDAVPRFDMLEHLCGPIEALSAEMTDATGRGFSTMAIALRFANGAVGSLVGTYDSSYAYPDTHRLELNGTIGRLLVHDTVRRFDALGGGRETREVWEAGYFNDLDREFPPDLRPPRRGAARRPADRRRAAGARPRRAARARARPRRDPLVRDGPARRGRRHDRR